MKAIERVMKALTDKGLKPSHVEQEIGLSNGYLATMLKRNANLGEEALVKIALYLNFSLNYLLTGLEEQKEVAIKSDGSKGVPLIPVEAMAGFGKGDISVMDYEIEEHYVLPNIKHVDFLLKVTGDSMLPKYNGGDLVACIKISELTFIQWNKIYVLDTTQGVIIKRLHEGKDDKHLICISENPKYASFIISKKDIRAIALVVGGVVIE